MDELRTEMKVHINEICKRDNVCKEIRGLALYCIDHMSTANLIQQAEEMGIIDKDKS